MIETEVIFTFEKDGYEVNFVEKKNYDELEEIKNELEEEGLEGKEFEDELKERAYGSEAIVITKGYKDDVPDDILKLAEKEYIKFNINK